MMDLITRYYTIFCILGVKTRFTIVDIISGDFKLLNSGSY